MSETMSEVTERQYQWKKGDNFGEIVTVESSDSEFTTFTNGARIFTNLISEFMEEVIDGNIPLPGAQNISFQTQDDIVAPQVPAQVQKPTLSTEDEKPKASALEELIEKLSKKNIEKFETSLNLNIPSRDIFNMLVNSADEDPSVLIDVIARVAVSKIEINKLQEYLTEEVTNYVKNYYNG